MHLRERTEHLEHEYLSSYASLADRTRGRRQPILECYVRTAFQRDRDRILHSKAFRRLKGKTQVFIAPEGDHYRTRLTHTLEVAQISRTVARGLRLNEDLTEAIALGHDLGHTPFGHAGEAALGLLFGGFRHNEQSLRVVEDLEELNLTYEVRDGIRGHTGEQMPETLEGQIVRICDRVAYLNHDIDDAVRGGIITETGLPHVVLHILGETRSQRIDTMVKDMLTVSQGQPRISVSPAVQDASDRLREFLFQTVYIGSEAKLEESKVYNVIRMFTEYYLENPGMLAERLGKSVSPEAHRRCLVDYIAGMTDGYAISEFQRLFLPKGWTRF